MRGDKGKPSVKIQIPEKRMSPKVFTELPPACLFEERQCLFADTQQLGEHHLFADKIVRRHHDRRRAALHEARFDQRERQVQASIKGQGARPLLNKPVGIEKDAAFDQAQMGDQLAGRPAMRARLCKPVRRANTGCGSKEGLLRDVEFLDDGLDLHWSSREFSRVSDRAQPLVAV